MKPICCNCWLRPVIDAVMKAVCVIVADGGRCQDLTSLRWEALSIFLENVMSRALTSDKATNVTEAGILLLKQLLVFSSPVSCIISTLPWLLILTVVVTAVILCTFLSGHNVVISELVGL